MNILDFVLQLFLVILFVMYLSVVFYKLHNLKAQKKRIDKKQEAIFKQGREQFQRLVSKNLNVPVMML